MSHEIPSERLDPAGWAKAGVGEIGIPNSWWVPLVRWFPKGSHLQEMGCCGASTALQLAMSSMRYTFTLLDFCQPLLQVAYDRFTDLQMATGVETDVRFIVQDALSANLDLIPEGDVAYSIGLLEHFTDEDIVTILKNQSRKCRTVMAAVPNALCTPYLEWKAKHEAEGTWMYGVEVPKTLEMMTDYFDQAGIDVIAHMTMGDGFIDKETDERYLLAVLGNVR